MGRNLSIILASNARLPWGGNARETRTGPEKDVSEMPRPGLLTHAIAASLTSLSEPVVAWVGVYLESR